MQVIYEVTNLYNQKNNILPFKYIGSQQKNTDSYLGSSKKLLKDIKILGKENFKKKILIKFPDFLNLTNCKLREIESLILKSLKCAETEIYYNKTNTSHKGYSETEEEKKIRMNKTHSAWKVWYNEKGGKEQIKNNAKKGKQNHMYGKTVYEFWLNKFGKEIADRKFSDYKKKISNINKNRPSEKKKISEELLQKMITLGKQGKTKKEIALELSVNFWLVVRYYKK